MRSVSITFVFFQLIGSPVLSPEIGAVFVISDRTVYAVQSQTGIELWQCNADFEVSTAVHVVC